MSIASEYSKGRSAARPDFRVKQDQPETEFVAQVEDNGRLKIAGCTSLRTADVLQFRNWLSETFGPQETAG